MSTPLNGTPIPTESWRDLLAWVVGPLLIGLAGGLIVMAAAQANHFHQLLLERHPRAPLLLMPIGFALIVYVVRRFFRNAQSCGIAQTLHACQDVDPAKKHHLLSLRILFGKIVMLIAGIAIGAPIGRDGPLVQIGASAMHLFHGRGVEQAVDRRRMLIAAGGAAGIAVAFNAPLAGLLFALEWLSRTLQLRTVARMALAAALAGWAGFRLAPEASLIAPSAAIIAGFSDLPLAILCGIVGGAAGGLFSRLTCRAMLRPPAVIASVMGNRPLLFAIFCGLFVAIIGVATGGTSIGSGDDILRTAMQGTNFSWGQAAGRMAAVFLTFVSGLPGGLIEPSLSIGALLGNCLWSLLPSVAPHAAMVLLIMAAYVAGVTRAPLTAFALVLEIAGSLPMLLPLMLAALVAAGASRLLCPVPLYDALTEKYAW